MKVLAFDYGASSGRAILGEYDGNKITLTEIHRFLNEPVEISGTLYWDALRLFHELKQGLLKAQQQGYTDIESLGIDTWGVDFGLLDKDGALLGNPVHYRDSRTDGMIEEVSKIIPNSALYGRTGSQVASINTLYQMYALKLNKPELLNSAQDMIFMPDLFAYFLTGEKVCEETIASTSQFLNPSTKEIDKELLETLGLPTKLLQKMVKPGTQIGMLKDDVIKELGLTYCPKVISVAQHDTASAVMAVPVSEDRFAYISSGTWSLLGSETPKPYLTETAQALNFTNEGGYNNTIRLLKNIMGLWIINECKRQWDKQGQCYGFGELCKMATETNSPDCFINPDDPVFMPPFGMVDRIQNYCKKTGQYVPQTIGEVMRCVIESLALKYKASLQGLEDILGYSLPVLHVVGGGCQNTLLCQFTANAIERPVVAGPIEATALGNIACQLISLGAIKDIKEARQVIGNSFGTVTYYPENTEVWNKKMETFKTLL